MQWLDVAPLVHDFRKAALHLLVKIARRSEQIPEFLYIQGVEVSDNARFSGGFGDVFKGTYRNRNEEIPVAVKRLKKSDSRNSSRSQVSLICPSVCHLEISEEP
jgi:hypothetical protein